MHTGQIIQLLAGFYDVLTENHEIIRTRARGNFRNQKTSPLVGDMVDFKESENDTGYITKIHARENELVRPPLANIDQAVVVTAATQPSFSANLLDRQLVALAEKKIDAVLYFSKTDLLSSAEFEELQTIAKYYQKIGYQIIFPTSDQPDADLVELKQSFKDKLTIFMGQTGAGKSTLLNRIDPKLNITTGEVSQALNRGKHTTRKVSLIPIEEGLVADTPGFSSYAVFEMADTELKEYFLDFKALSSECRFRECLHLNEPGCAVKAAVEAGTVIESRYTNYEQFIELIRNQKPDYKRKGYQKKDRRKKK
jgi:ribosome biogenesis GTPase